MKLSELEEDLGSPSDFLVRPVSQELILELLNHAVWAPNDGLREPWRFIFADNRNGKLMEGLQEHAPAYLLVLVKEEADHHKREEDFAAVYCLIQNFRLLAYEQGLGVRSTLHDWMYDRSRAETFGVLGNERIAAVLDLGYGAEQPEGKDELAEPQVQFELL
ncbi:nitroreductase family protein [Paenibacillus sp. F6_3S_P_1C]|uniref:Nitroreductase family protein n=1 Tax=Paenibacillus vandeheii TaxID=3035917 RepID=A0ABT8JBA4_9BACL|nr:nitroreductase family protein [Paenibacillus vandeheii]MDN4602379.1 nitroreductase family protein [Paenibacillus vandeheii]